MRTLQQTLALFQKAQQQRTRRESRFGQCFKYAMPGRQSFTSEDPESEIDDVFDETAIIATQEFASRLQSGITPNFSRWATLKAGSDIPPDDRDEVDTALQDVTRFCFEIMDQSNFGTESYEAYLDLSVSLGCFELERGTAIEPLRFNAVPMTELWILNGPYGRIDNFFRMRSWTYEDLMVRYPDFKMEAGALQTFKECGKAWNFLEATWRDWTQPNDFVYHRHIICMEQNQEIVQKVEYKGAGSCPMIAFRWSKEAGSIWGRGPLMNALPAVKTVNLVMQLVLENAQMAIAGLYNMDDDGVINPDTIQLMPGTIIPRAPGNRGLEPVQPAGNFNVADIILSEQRTNIKRALYNDMLGNPDKTPMSATEVAERMADLARQIGSAFGRLMFEMVIPTLQRVVFILKQMKLVELPTVNGREISVTATSPLAQAQNQQDIQAVDRLAEWIGMRYGAQFVAIFLKPEDTIPYVAEKLQAPAKLLRTGQEIEGAVQQFAPLLQQGGMAAPADAMMPAAADGAPVV